MTRWTTILTTWLLGCLLLATAKDPAYDPLVLPDAAAPTVHDLTVTDAKRQRDIPIRVYLPAAKPAAPVLMFSHGLGGSREGSAFLGQHWAARGYVVVYLQHPGSDAAVWQDADPKRRYATLKKAGNLQNFMLRVQDVSAVLDQLALWQAEADHPLAGRLDLEKVGMSGHSFGAMTTQAVSGQAMGRGKTPFLDDRIDAAVIMSPSAPRLGKPADAFGKIATPWLLMTGTMDTAAIGNITVEDRLAVYPALPAGSAYELVLHRAEHSAFTERALPGETEPRNPNHHRVILALSTAFWDAYLRDDPAARAWLDSDAPRTIMQPDDRWQHK